MLSQAEEYTELGQAVGFTVVTMGLLRAWKAWERPEGAPLLPCGTGDGAQARPDTPSSSHLTSPWHSGDGLVSSSGARDQAVEQEGLLATVQLHTVIYR